MSFRNNFAFTERGLLAPRQIRAPVPPIVKLKSQSLLNVTYFRLKNFTPTFRFPTFFQNCNFLCFLKAHFTYQFISNLQLKYETIVSLSKTFRHIVSVASLNITINSLQNFCRIFGFMKCSMKWMVMQNFMD